jgi:hypothetical protein
MTITHRLFVFLVAHKFDPWYVKDVERMENLCDKSDLIIVM